MLFIIASVATFSSMGKTIDHRHQRATGTVDITHKIRVLRIFGNALVLKNGLPLLSLGDETDFTNIIHGGHIQSVK